MSTNPWYLDGLSKVNLKLRSENSDDLMMSGFSLFEKIRMTDILLVGNPFAKIESIKSKQIELSTTGRKIHFEQLDRIEFLSNLALSSTISQIQTGVIEPAAFPHSMQVLSKFAKSLSPLGKLELTEPVLVDSAALLEVQKISTNKNLPNRTER